MSGLCDRMHQDQNTTYRTLLQASVALLLMCGNVTIEACEGWQVSTFTYEQAHTLHTVVYKNFLPKSRPQVTRGLFRALVRVLPT